MCAGGLQLLTKPGAEGAWPVLMTVTDKEDLRKDAVGHLTDAFHRNDILLLDFHYLH